MKVQTPDNRRVVLIPATEDSVAVGVQHGTDDGIAVSIDVTTATLGEFTIPLTAHQVGAIAATCRWLLKLDADQVAQLRADIQRKTEEGEQQ